MGRRSKLTPEVQSRIVQAVRAGNYYETACEYAGVDRTTFWAWMKRGERESSGMYRDFQDTVKRARSESEVRAVAVITTAMPTSWQAAAWYLERSAPSRWGKTVQQVELTGKDGGAVEVVSARDLLLERLTRLAQGGIDDGDNGDTDDEDAG